MFLTKITIFYPISSFYLHTGVLVIACVSGSIYCLSSLKSMHRIGELFPKMSEHEDTHEIMVSMAASGLSYKSVSVSDLKAEKENLQRLVSIL